MHQWWIDCRAPGKYWDHWSAAERPLTGPHEGGRSLVVAPERRRLSILHFSEKRAEMISMCYSKFYMCQITEDNSQIVFCTQIDMVGNERSITATVGPLKELMRSDYVSLQKDTNSFKTMELLCFWDINSKNYI